MNLEVQVNQDLYGLIEEQWKHGIVLDIFMEDQFLLVLLGHV